jgi:hypothetical protein
MMPMRLGRKAQRLEKVENLCRTATTEKNFPTPAQKILGGLASTRTLSERTYGEIEANF